MGGTETDPEADDGIPQQPKNDKAQTSVSSFDSEHWAGTEQGAADPGAERSEEVHAG